MRIRAFVLAALAVAQAGIAHAETFGRIGPTIAVAPEVLKTPRLNVQPPILPVLPRRNCPDLRVSMNQRDLPTGEIEIAYAVANVGGVPYVSGANQQGLMLYSNSRVVRNHAFRNLRPGESRRFTTIYRPFEFPAQYRALVSFDPDIFIDGNPANDDCNRSNNEASLRTSR